MPTDRTDILKDAPAKLRELKETLSGFSWIYLYCTELEWLESLAAALEALRLPSCKHAYPCNCFSTPRQPTAKED